MILREFDEIGRFPVAGGDSAEFYFVVRDDLFDFLRVNASGEGFGAEFFV